MLHQIIMLSSILGFYLCHSVIILNTFFDSLPERKQVSRQIRKGSLLKLKKGSSLLDGMSGGVYLIHLMTMRAMSLNDHRMSCAFMRLLDKLGKKENAS